MKVALLELNPYHGETLPAVTEALLAVGATVDLVAHPRTLAHEPLGERVADLRRVESWSSPWGRLRRRLGELRGYDLVVANSVEPDWVLRRIDRLLPPLVGIVHNGVLADEEPTKRFFASTRRKAAVLSPHVAAYVGEPISPVVIRPVVASIAVGQVPAREKARAFCVPGNVEIARRDYYALLDAVEAIVHDGDRSFEVWCAGRSTHPDAYRLRAEIARRGLRDVFRFTAEEVPYRVIYEQVGRAAFVVPLLHHAQSSNRTYLRDKSSASMWIAVACGSLLVAEGDVLAAYGIAAGLAYPGGGLETAMRRALAMPAEELDTRLQGVREERVRAVTANVQSMLQAIASVGVADRLGADVGGR